MNEKEKINPDIKYEPIDVSAKWLGAIGVLIVITAIILPFLLWGIYGHLEQTAAKGAPIPESESRKRFDAPPAPQLEPNPVESYQKFRGAENEKLNEYGWVDREKRIVHIPIKQAMQMLVQQGLPEVQTANQLREATSSNQTQSNSQTINEDAANKNGGRK